MVVFILSFIAFVLFLSIGIYHLGSQTAYSKVVRKNLITRDIESNKEDCCLGIMLGAYAGVFALIILTCVGFPEIRKNHIDKWRSNEIIEQVHYRYNRVNGEQEVVDSAFNYVKNPNFKR